MQALVCSADGVMAAASLDEVRQYVQGGQKLVWLDFSGQISQQEQDTMQSWFGFHELALEDAAKFADTEARRQRPKVEEYQDHYFMVVQSVSRERGEEGPLALGLHELDLFVGASFVVSVHRDPIGELEELWHEVQRRPMLTACSSDRLVYYILDAVVDNYIQVADNVEDVLDDLIDSVVDLKTGRDAVRVVFSLKRELVHFRRAATPLRDVINQMTSRDFPFVGENTRLYLRDVYDHVIRISDMIDSYRDMLTGALDVYLSAVSNSMNLVMKRLTVVATIFLPLTFITGFWGMNFIGLMPIDNAAWYWGSVAFMGMLGTGMGLYLAWSWVTKWM